MSWGGALERRRYTHVHVHVHTPASGGVSDSIRHRQDSSFHRERIKGSRRGSLFSPVHVMPCTVRHHRPARQHGAGPDPSAVFGMHPGRSRTLRVSTSLGLIKIHERAKSRSVCSSQRNIDFPALRSWMRGSECWTRGQIPRLTSNPSVEPLSLTRGWPG